MYIEKDIDENIKYLDLRFKEFGDIVKRKFPIGEHRETNLYISYIDVMTDRAFIDELMDILMIDIRQVKPTSD